MKVPKAESASEVFATDAREPANYRTLAGELLAGHKLAPDALAQQLASKLSPEELDRTVVALQRGLSSEFWKIQREATLSRIAADLRTGIMGVDSVTRLQAMDRVRCRLDLLMEPMLHLHVCKSQLTKPKE